MTDTKPPRVLGVLLAVLGAAMIVGGFSILNMGGGSYFIAVGAGVIVAGILIASGKLLGAYAYGATLLMVVIWSFAEEGTNLPGLLSRIALPILFAVYIFSAKIRSRLT